MFLSFVLLIGLSITGYDEVSGIVDEIEEVIGKAQDKFEEDNRVHLEKLIDEISEVEARIEGEVSREYYIIR